MKLITLYTMIKKNKRILKRKEGIPKNIYFFSLLFTVFFRGWKEIKIDYSFWLVLFTAIFFGIISGLLFYKVD